jgi:hypothetical protein
LNNKIKRPEAGWIRERDRRTAEAKKKWLEANWIIRARGRRTADTKGKRLEATHILRETGWRPAKC